jgi:hypothetical protein
LPNTSNDTPGTPAPDSTPAAPAAPANEVQAPAQPAVASPAPAVPAAAQTAQFEKSGDPGLDFAIDYVAKLGVTPTDPEYLAAQTGNFDLLRVKLATMGDKAQGYEAVLAVAEKAFKGLTEQREAANKARTELIVGEVGGQEQWNALREWVKTNADESERGDINAGLNGSPLQAKMTVQYLKGLFAQASNTSNPPKTAVNPHAGGTPPSGDSGPLSPKDYSAAVIALVAQLGGKPLESSPEYENLKRRRLAWAG